MAVINEGEKFKCGVCENEIEVRKVGGGTLICCGQDMDKSE